MRFVWEDYDFERHAFVDLWESADIKRFATKRKWSDEWKYYSDSDEYNAGRDVFCKIVKDGDAVLAALIVFCDPKYPLSINPIVVNPKYCGRGYGFAVLKELVENADKIFPSRVNGTFEVVVSKKNIASVKIFKKLGFMEKPDCENDGHIRFVKLAYR
ncbi:MAG: GNAT family N-acetyltransferase [Clostridiales bacterium]|jgi:RimJ/RimL family protein N-acetyltransferase|nr:GNAT family N-acetyltransferase [Clostridiales bacterium]